jgi:L,D-transpeptidase YbiS
MRENNTFQDQNIPPLERSGVGGKRLFWTFVLGLFFSVGIAIPAVQNFYQLQFIASEFKPGSTVSMTAGRIGVDNIKKHQSALAKEITGIGNKLNELIPKQNYLIINTSGNDFTLMNSNDIIRTGKCSTGSYTLLKGKKEQQWIFKTPRGMLKILRKMKDPVWKKPDWAFIEEGLPVPSANHPSRFDYGTLGDYSLHLGDGYMIHGTLYKRFLGMPVTHGCIRMGDEDLEVIFNSLPIGSKVYIY